MKNKILENWKAIEEVEAKVKEKTGDPQAGFNASTFWFGADGRHLMIPCMYRGKKGKKGQEEFTNSYKELMVYATFCPFTGTPLYEDSVFIIDQEKLNLKSRIKELEEKTNICYHPYRALERNENGLFCNKCKQQVSSNQNIY